MSDISLAAIAEALQIPAGELDKFRKDGDVDVTPEVFEKKVTEHLKTKYSGDIDRTKTGSWNDGFKAAERKTLTDKERDLKAKYPGIEGKTLDELFDAAFKHGGNTDWTQDPKVKGELDGRDARIRALEQELASAKSDKDRTVSAMKLEKTVPDMLKDKFKIPTEARTAQKRMNLLMGEILREGKVEVRDINGEQVPWDIEKNKRLQNDKYQDISLEELVLAAAADLYDPITGSGHQAPGNGEDAAKGPVGSGDLASIQTWDDVLKYKNAITVTDKDAKAKLQALKEHVEKLKATGKLKDV